MTYESTNSLDYFTTLQNNIENVSLTEKNNEVRIFLYTYGFVLKTCSIYLLTSMAYFQYITNKNETKTQRKTSKKKDSRFKKALKWKLNEFCLLTCFFGFLTSMMDSPIASLNKTSNLACKILQGASTFLYSLGTLCLYTFLWLRQRACYRNRSLRVLQSRLTNLLSKFVLPIYIALKTVGIILTCTVWDFETSLEGCLETSHSQTPIIVMYVASVVMHSVLLTLFLKPLKHHISFAPKNLNSSDGIKGKDNRLKKLVRRCVLSTALCVATDTLSFIVSMVIPSDLITKSIVINYIYDTDLILNIVFINGSFANWDKRLWPWKLNSTVDEIDNNVDYISSMTRSSTPAASAPIAYKPIKKDNNDESLENNQEINFC